MGKRTKTVTWTTLLRKRMIRRREERRKMRQRIQRIKPRRRIRRTETLSMILIRRAKIRIGADMKKRTIIKKERTRKAMRKSSPRKTASTPDIALRLRLKIKTRIEIDQEITNVRRIRKNRKKKKTRIEAKRKRTRRKKRKI